MDLQAAFNIVTALVGALGGWILNTIWRSMRDLQIADESLAHKVQGIEVLVAGQYPTRRELDDKFVTVHCSLVRIEDKLDKKADRQDHRSRLND